MATTKSAKRPAKKSAKKASRAVKVPKNEAIAQLTADHARVKKMFRQYDKLAKADAGDSEKQQVATLICAALTGPVWPLSGLPIALPDLIDEADVEHASAKDLIAQIEGSSPSDDHYDAKVKVLGEYIDHHVQEEEGEIFPKVRRAKLDTVALGEQLAQRKAQIMQKKGLA